MRPGHQAAAPAGVRLQRPQLVAADNSIHHAEHFAPRRRVHLSGGVGEKQNLREVRRHPPRRVVAVPVPRVHRLGCLRHPQKRLHRPPVNLHPRLIHRVRRLRLLREKTVVGPALDFHQRTVRARLRVGQLIAAVLRRAEAVVDQVILVRVDAHQTLEVQRHADLFVGLHLGHREEDIRREDGLGHAVLVRLAVVMRDGLLPVEIRAVVVLVRQPVEVALAPEVDDHAAGGIARELLAVLGQRRFAMIDHCEIPQVIRLDFESELGPVKLLDRVEPLRPHQFIPVAIHLRHIRNHDAALALQRDERVIHQCPQDRGMRDDGEQILPAVVEAEHVVGF